MTRLCLRTVSVGPISSVVESPRNWPVSHDYYCDCLQQKKYFRIPVMGPRLVAALWSYSLTFWQARNDSRYKSTTGTFHPEHLSRLDEEISEAYLHPDRGPLALRPTIFSQPLVTRLA